jgi:hypothetical protein
MSSCAIPISFVTWPFLKHDFLSFVILYLAVDLPLPPRTLLDDYSTTCRRALQHRATAKKLNKYTKIPGCYWMICEGVDTQLFIRNNTMGYTNIHTCACILVSSRYPEKNNMHGSFSGAYLPIVASGQCQFWACRSCTFNLWILFISRGATD